MLCIQKITNWQNQLSVEVIYSAHGDNINLRVPITGETTEEMYGVGNER